MRLSSALLFACLLSGVVMSGKAQQAQPCPGQCEAEWRPVCGLSAKRGVRTFSNVCMMSDWNRCNKGDYQVSKFSVC